MSQPIFRCQRCGRCCLRFFEISAHPTDIERWALEGRDDILQYADMVTFYVFGEADLWIDPNTIEELTRCPFLRQVGNKKMYTCKIHDTRPRACKRFPHLKYDANGELVGAHPWAIENCPGVQALLKEWTPQQIQVLLDRERKRGEIHPEVMAFL